MQPHKHLQIIVLSFIISFQITWEQKQQGQHSTVTEMLKRLGSVWGCRKPKAAQQQQGCIRHRSHVLLGQRDQCCLAAPLAFSTPAEEQKLLIQAKGNYSRCQTSLKVAKLSSSDPSLHLSHCSSSTHFRPGSMLPFLSVRDWALRSGINSLTSSNLPTAKTLDFIFYLESGQFFSSFHHYSFRL